MTSYNEWLRDWLKAGNMPTHFYLRNGANSVIPVENPEGVYFPVQNMYGARSIDFVLNRKYDYNEHCQRFRGGHNNLYGWNSKGEPVCAGFHGLQFVPAYLDTIDHEMVRNRELPGWMISKLEKSWAKEKAAEAAFEINNQREINESASTWQAIEINLARLYANNTQYRA